MTKLITTSLFISHLFFANTALANWQVDQDKSDLHFVSVKKNTIGEVHHFDQFSGMVSTQGDVKFDVALASVNTGIAIRDERMQVFLFETDKFSQASFSGKVDAKALANLTAGGAGKLALSGELSLHGQSQAFNLMVNVVKLNNGDLMVSNIAPMVIQAEQFALTNGILKLQELAGLPSISTVVPVNFSFYLSNLN
ncbi:YceI family protein [Thalassotalea sp. LPB0316]|uniref:YceI family protein n=1 Tax=Thalassotalea sp. LPB0316 TaxID=2769490 RepID=UPI001865CC88|nr:YceI family protein [Thalassotalea sp. LPB0316]QOL26601.1 YceI family protein [Thalassotalea sp. LPB0316]